METNQKYAFKKPYTMEIGTIPEGTEVGIFRGLVYINGMIADNYSSGLIKSIINDKKKSQEYLKKLIIPIHKI